VQLTFAPFVWITTRRVSNALNNGLGVWLEFLCARDCFFLRWENIARTLRAAPTHCEVALLALFNVKFPVLRHRHAL
jgi:hypothetical protein